MLVHVVYRADGGYVSETVESHGPANTPNGKQYWWFDDDYGLFIIPAADVVSIQPA